MRLRTHDGKIHEAALTTEHACSSYGQPIVVLQDTKEAIDLFNWQLCELVEADEHERAALAAAGYAMESPVTALVDQFFVDCTRENRTPDDESLRAWLWFTCPAHLRSKVEPAIRADVRFGRHVD